MMLERYAVIISEGAPDPMLPEVEGEWVKYADAHATIADLQGQLATAKAPRVYDCGSCAIGKGFEQRVAQLEGENDSIKRDTASMIDVATNRLKEELRDLQADHARVLGLVRKLPASLTGNVTVYETEGGRRTDFQVE